MKASVFLLLALTLGFVAAIAIDAAKINLDLLWRFMVPLDVLFLVLLLVALTIERKDMRRKKLQLLETEKTSAREHSTSSTTAI